MTLPRYRILPAAVLLAAACTTAGSPAGQSAAATIRPETLMAHVAALAADSMEGRLIGSPGGARARAYVLRAFVTAGLEPVRGRYEQPFEARSLRDSTVVRRGVNVVGQIRGLTDPDHYIVVTAHYDHLGVRDGQVYNGADDNASGTAALLELARWFRTHLPAHTLVFAALDGEEGGLTGAREFVRQATVPPERIVLNVNMDMVGRNARNELFASGTSHYPFLRPYLDSVAARAPVTLRFGHDDPNGPRQDDWTTQSDHAAFHAARIPFVYFGEEDHPDYHRPTDDTERLMPAFYAGAATTVLDALRVFDRNLAAIAAASGR